MATKAFQKIYTKDSQGLPGNLFAESARVAMMSWQRVNGKLAQW